MRKLIITGMAVAMLAVPAAAMAAPTTGQAQSADKTLCSGHGAFAYFGEQGERHDFGQGDNMGDAYLGASPLTGPTGVRLWQRHPGAPRHRDPVR